MIPRAEHVFVDDVKVWGDRAAPALLLGWRRGRTGEWEGFVILVHTGPQNSGPYVSQRWVPAASIRRSPT